MLIHTSDKLYIRLRIIKKYRRAAHVYIQLPSNTHVYEIHKHNFLIKVTLQYLKFKANFFLYG